MGPASRRPGGRARQVDRGGGALLRVFLKVAQRHAAQPPPDRGHIPREWQTDQREHHPAADDVQRLRDCHPALSSIAFVNLPAALRPETVEVPF